MFKTARFSDKQAVFFIMLDIGIMFRIGILGLIMSRIGIMCDIIACFIDKSYGHEAHTFIRSFLSFLFCYFRVFLPFCLLFLDF